MSLVKSKNIDLGKKAPDFCLIDVISNQSKTLTNLKGEVGTVIMFICNHCPFVIHVNNELVKLGNDYISKGINFIAISSNDIEYYPQDSPAYMKQVANKLNYPFPYLYDDSQEVAKSYDAVCTPDFYLYDNDLKLVYHGQLDKSRPGNGLPLNGLDMRNAINLLLKNELNASLQQPSIGCSIKWK